MILLACAHTAQAFGFVNLPSCRAGTYFRYAAKVSKDAPKEEGKPFRAVFLLPLETIILSADRGTPPRIKCAGSHVFECVKLVPATLGYLN